MTITMTDEHTAVLDRSSNEGSRADRCAPRIDFVQLRTRWRGHVQFATSVDEDAYRDQVFDGLSLTLPAGRITVLLGARGAGKSLLGCHLLGVAAPDAGQILVDGRSIWDMPERQRRELRDSFGVFRGGTRIQQSALVDSLTVFDNLVAQLLAHGRTERVEQTAREYLSDFALTEHTETLPGGVDSSARRRLGLALALAGDPALVVIDDPGQALDRHHADRLIASIKRWQARTGSTMLITVRSLKVAKALGHQVVVLREGKVTAHGSPDVVLSEVVDDETFQRRFGTDLGGFAETDPGRARRRAHQVRRVEQRRHLALVVAFLLLGMSTVAMLLSGLLANPVSW